MSDLNALVSSALAPIVLLFGAVAILLVVAMFVLLRRVRGIAAHLALLTRGEGGRDLGDVLEAHLAKVYAVSRRQDDIDARAGALERQARRSMQGISVVRYNTFEDTGGNQSFALAVCDPEGNGVVLSSLHARNQTRVYAKGVAAGAAEGALSEEETEALRQAMTRAVGR